MTEKKSCGNCGYGDPTDILLHPNLISCGIGTIHPQDHVCDLHKGADK